jgi:hypothetical protein
MSGLGKTACVILRLAVLFNRYVFVATVRSPILPDWNAASSSQELAALFHRWRTLHARRSHGPRSLVICTSRRNLLDAKSRQAGEITDDC